MPDLHGGRAPPPRRAACGRSRATSRTCSTTPSSRVSSSTRRDVTDRREAEDRAPAQRDGTARDRAGVAGRDPRARPIVRTCTSWNLACEQSCSAGPRPTSSAARRRSTARGARSRAARRGARSTGTTITGYEASVIAPRRTSRHRREPRDRAARRQHRARSDRVVIAADVTEQKVAATRRRRERGPLPFARAAPHRHDPRARARRHDRVRQPECVGVSSASMPSD